MGKTRIDAPKVKKQCLSCGEWDGKWSGNFTDALCGKGISVVCRRQSRKKCPYYRRPSVIEAAKGLAEAAGINLKDVTFKAKGGKNI